MEIKDVAPVILIIIGISLMFSYFGYTKTNTSTLVESNTYGGDGMSHGGSFYGFSLKKGDVIEFGDLIGPANVTIRIRINQGLEWKVNENLNAITDERGGFEFMAPQDGAYELRIDNPGDTQEYFSVRLIGYEKYVLLLYGGALLAIAGLIITVLIFSRNVQRLKRVPLPPPPQDRSTHKNSGAMHPRNKNLFIKSFKQRILTK